MIAFGETERSRPLHAEPQRVPCGEQNLLLRGKELLKILPGEFSGLHLVSMVYVGTKRIAPTGDPGIDLSAEYAAAQRLYGRKEEAE